jgi:hypothetical protein
MKRAIKQKRNGEKNEAGGRRESNEIGGMERERKKEEEWREK